MSTEQPKVFGIGLSKTGTSSLAQALQRLGFRTKDCMGVTQYVAGDLSSIDMDTVLAHDALTDTPIPSFYRELDQRFPGSKFILTVRDRDGWLQSCRKQFNERLAAKQTAAHNRLFEDLYGTDVFDEQRFVAGYERFVAGVTEYFKARPQDLLVMNVAAGDGWETLCPFLGRPVPDTPFPKANVTQILWMNIGDIVAVAESAGRELLKRYRGDVKRPAESKKPVQPLAAGKLLNRVLDVALGRDAMDAAAEAAHKVLVARLSRMGGHVPLLSPLTQVPAYAERRNWNHVWLIDPLDGREAFANGSAEFSVNIALIEDGKPIYGVVHAPALALTYYGRLGQGAFKRVAAGEPVSLSTSRNEVSAADVPIAGPQLGTDGSRSLSMCSVLEQRPATKLAFEPTPEWRAAAAHAVLQLAELRPLDCDSGAEPNYNSNELTVGPLCIGAE